MDQPKPIIYPRITIPGRGEFEVKFGLAAARLIDRDLGVDGYTVLQRLRDALPKDDPSGARDAEGNPKKVLGQIRLDFLFSLVSACTWSQAHMTAEEIAQAFDDEPLWDATVKLVGVLITAVSKTKWSALLRLQETATPAQESSPAPTLN